MHWERAGEGAVPPLSGRQGDSVERENEQRRGGNRWFWKDSAYESRRTYSTHSELYLNTSNGKDAVNSVAEQLVTINFLSFFDAFSVSVFILVPEFAKASAISHTIVTLGLVLVWRAMEMQIVIFMLSKCGHAEIVLKRANCTWGNQYTHNRYSHVAIFLICDPGPQNQSYVAWVYFYTQ